MTTNLFQVIRNRLARYEGYIDDVDEYDGVRGWARDRFCKKKKVEVEFLCEGKLIGSVVADRSRADLVREKKGDGCHAFVFRLPKSVVEGGMQSKVTARIMGTTFSLGGELLCGFDSCIDGSEFEGACERLTSTVVKGWVLKKNDPDCPVIVEVCDGLRKVMELPANMYRRDLQKAGFGTGRHGFRFMLPPSFFDGKSHKLNVRTKEKKIILRNCPIAVSPKDLRKILIERCTHEMQQGLDKIKKMRDAGYL